MQTFKHYVTMCGDKLTRKGVYYKNTKTLNEKENITQKPLKRKKKKKFKKYYPWLWSHKNTGKILNVYL